MAEINDKDLEKVAELKDSELEGIVGGVELRAGI